MLLDNGNIKVTGQRDDYHEVDVIEVCLAEEESDDEYASCDMVAELTVFITNG